LSLEKRATHCSHARACVQSRAALLHIVFRNPQDSKARNLKAAARGFQPRNLKI